MLLHSCILQSTLLTMKCWQRCWKEQPRHHEQPCLQGKRVQLQHWQSSSCNSCLCCIRDELLWRPRLLEVLGVPPQMRNLFLVWQRWHGHHRAALIGSVMPPLKQVRLQPQLWRLQLPRRVDGGCPSQRPTQEPLGPHLASQIDYEHLLLQHSPGWKEWARQRRHSQALQAKILVQQGRNRRYRREKPWVPVCH